MQKPRIDIIYLIVLIGIIFVAVKSETLNTQNLITYLAFFDVVVGVVLIIKGFVTWDMSYIFTGAFCTLSSYYSWKDMSDLSLVLLILSGLVGVGNHVRKTFKNLFG